METAIIALLAVTVILLIVILARQGKQKNPEALMKIDAVSEKVTELSHSLGSEFERSRREMQNSQQSMRAETGEKLT